MKSETRKVETALWVGALLSGGHVAAVGEWGGVTGDELGGKGSC